MSNTLVRFGTPADESRVFTLLTALMEGELVAGSPIEQSSTARATFRDLLTSDRGSVIVFEVDGEVLGVVTCSYVTAIRYGVTTRGWKNSSLTTEHAERARAKYL